MHAKLGGVHVGVGSRGFGLRVSRYGRAGGRDGTLALAEAQVLPGEARFFHERGLEEWWRAGARGYEHGFVLAERPEGSAPVELRIAVEGDARVRGTADALELRVPDGPTLRYAELRVVDAAGRVLGATLAATDEGVAIRIDDTDARYPVVVDPTLYVLAAKTLAGDKRTDDHFGAALAMPGDGTRLFVGAPDDDYQTLLTFFDAGTVRVFRRTPSGLVPEATLPQNIPYDDTRFGASVATTASADRLAAGAPTPADIGSVEVYARTGTTWTFEAHLVAPDGAVQDAFGTGVALSADGTTLVIGSPESSDPPVSRNGAVYVFTRVGTTWSFSERLVAMDRESLASFGSAVALDASGDRLVVGASYATVGAFARAGAAYVFERAAGSFTERGRYVASDAGDQDRFGTTVAITADGSCFAVSAPNADDEVPPAKGDSGAVYVFEQSGAVFAQRARVVDPARATDDRFGSGIALDGSGDRLVVGIEGAADTTGLPAADAGAALVFDYDGSTYVPGQRIVAFDRLDGDGAGAAVALSGDGWRLSVGVPLEDDATTMTTTDNGAVYHYELGRDGAACGADGDCVSGACDDGVCCATACGDALDDCQACSSASTGLADGTCGPLTSSVAAATICRTSTAACDPAETCAVGSTACPADRIADTTVVCRPAVAGGCDLEERCDGLVSACPPDGVATPGFVCRPAAAGGCDVPEVCDGVAATCPSDAHALPNTVCRPGAGPCDLPEVCDGAGVTCPGDALAVFGAPCRIAVGPCDVTETCSGTSAACPPDLFAPVDTVCDVAFGACDAPDRCTGTSSVCPESVLPDGSYCDDGDLCSVTSACMAGACTATLSLDCTDTDPCTIDLCQSGIGCRHDPIPACLTDAGADASGADLGTDGGAGVVTQSAGCDCTVGPRRPDVGPVLVYSAALAALIRRFSRRRRA